MELCSDPRELVEDGHELTRYDVVKGVTHEFGSPALNNVPWSYVPPARGTWEASRFAWLLASDPLLAFCRFQRLAEAKFTTAHVKAVESKYKPKPKAKNKKKGHSAGEESKTGLRHFQLVANLLIFGKATTHRIPLQMFANEVR